ncbi:MAG: hypothetical protein QF386_03415 [Alphaproteobacteria bacterium]|jgi:hypothetical protein|nr:hypothetical protein [Rhodospirillaceae bacterium]MDP6486124.1 hypothetical protein [Alphaproteobacteria bacterium]MDP6781263.1 hypothetical protein [Alphaproteobacteria bacterium]MDP7044658.1 hypothetical protein [Alphaproteobacteria bacterium]HAQ32760.1 hypothetical protein [Rhodospirillaceae bacterium]|tara:strand:+ start:2943 stop:3191 length:249 start_codon:yes stop_codon:yes gene_type:complete
MLKKINRSLIWLASWIFMPVSIIRLLCPLVRNLRKYRQVDIIFHAGGPSLIDFMTPCEDIRHLDLAVRDNAVISPVIYPAAG